MQWQLGGNFEPVFMICEIDWKACPAAIANYIWTEIVTDVVDCIANDTWLMWRIVAIISLAILTLRLLYRKLRCTDEVARNKETLSKVGCRMQDLELKINILTYKMQYGTWPMPHQLRGPNARKQLRNIRLTLSNYDDRNHWIKRMLLGPPSISCTSCSNPDTSVQRLNEVFNTNNICNFKSDRSESTNSNTKSTRSSSGRSLKRWRRTVRNSDIIKMREERQSRSEKFLLRYRDVEAMRDKSKNLLPEQCNKYLESMEDCKKFLQELKNGNQSLGFIGDSSGTNDDSSTNYDCKQKMSQTQKASREESYTKSGEVEQIANVKIASQKPKCSSQARHSDENNLNASNIVSVPTKSTISTNEPTVTGFSSRHKQATNQAQPIQRSSQHTLRLVHRKLESLHNLLQKYNSTGSIKTSSEKKKTQARSALNFATPSNTNVIRERQRSKTFHGTKQESKLSYTRSRKESTSHRSPRGNKSMFHRSKQASDYREQNSLTSELTLEESEREGSADSNSENSYLSLRSHSDTVVYDNEKYRGPIELSDSEVSGPKRTVSWSDISTSMSNNPKRSDNSAQLSLGYSNTVNPSTCSERKRYPSSSDSCRKAVKFVKVKRCDKSEKRFDVRERASTSSVCSQSNDTENQTFKSTRSSVSDVSKLSDFEVRSTIALLREALEVKKALVQQLESHATSQNEICLAAIESRKRFESKLLDAITEESPNTSTAKTSRTFVFVEGEKNDKATESRNSSANSASTAGKQLVASNLQNSNCGPLNSSSQYFSVSNLMQNDELDIVRRAFETMKCPNSGIGLCEAEFGSRSIVVEMERNSELVEEWERFCVESDKIENKVEDETLNTDNMSKQKLCTDCDKNTDERENESMVERTVSQESVESWKQSCEEPFTTDQSVANETVTTADAMTEDVAASWSTFCKEANKGDKELKDKISQRNVSKRSVDTRAKFCDLAKKSRLNSSTSINLKENSNESSKEFDEASSNLDNEMEERSIAKDIDNLVGQRVNDVRYLTELFSQSQKEAIMEIQKEIRESKSKSNASTEDTESSGDENSRKATLNNEDIREDRSTENESSLDDENVCDNTPVLFLSRRPSTEDESKKQATNLTKKLDTGTANALTSKSDKAWLTETVQKDKTEANSVTKLNDDLQKVDTKIFEASDNSNAQKSVNDPPQMQIDNLLSVSPSVTECTESYPRISSQENSSHVTNGPSIPSKKQSKIAIFNNDLRDNIAIEKHLKKTDTSQSINTGQRCSVGTKSNKGAHTETADSREEVIENVDNRHSISVPSVNFSSDTSTSYVDANSASSVFHNSGINSTRTTQTSEKDVHALSLPSQSLEKRTKNAKCNLPSSKYSKPSALSDKLQTQDLGTLRSLSTQHLKTGKNPRLKGRSNSCLTEVKTEESRVTSKVVERSIQFHRPRSRSQIACKFESTSKCQLEMTTKSVGRRNNSSDSIKSDGQGRILTPETKVSSRSCIPILKTRLTKEGRPKSPARSPLTMTMLWTVNSSFNDEDSSEKIVKVEGGSNKVKPKTETGESKGEEGDRSKNSAFADKHFVLVPEAKSMLYMQIFADRDRSLIRIVDPKTFLGYLRDRELKIQNVVHEDRSESLICRKNSFLTVIEQASDVNSKFLAIVPATVDEDDLRGNGAERVCVARSGAWMDFRPVSVRQREIFVTAKPSVIHTSTSISDLRDECVDHTGKVKSKGKSNKLFVKSVRSRKAEMVNECV